jgi:hypothetical protein
MATEHTRDRSVLATPCQFGWGWDRASADIVTLSWAPEDMGNDAYVDLDPVADTARLLHQELTLADADDLTGQQPGHERLRTLLCAVAADLNTHDWSQVMQTTDDFVVYPVDVEMVDLDRDMAACLPADWLAHFRERFHT